MQIETEVKSTIANDLNALINKHATIFRTEWQKYARLFRFELKPVFDDCNAKHMAIEFRIRAITAHYTSLPNDSALKQQQAVILEMLNVFAPDKKLDAFRIAQDGFTHVSFAVVNQTDLKNPKEFVFETDDDVSSMQLKVVDYSSVMDLANGLMKRFIAVALRKSKLSVVIGDLSGLKWGGMDQELEGMRA